MGVHMLESYFEKTKSSEYCYKVSIQDLAHKYRNETGKTPLILVDGPNSLRNILRDNEPHWILGGQLKAFVELSRLLVTSFKNVGVDLKFVFASIVPGNKKDTWISRRDYNIQKVVELFQMLKHRRPYDKNYMIPPIVGATARFAFKFECNSDVEITLDEHDVEIARYAHANDCFGILSQDTDFVIMDGARYYFSLKHLRLDTMTTLVYDREGFKKALQLQQHELLLLPPLMGCEAVPYTKLHFFHQKICPSKHPKYRDPTKFIPQLIKYIKGKNIQNNGNFDYLREISVDVFGNEDMAQDLEICIRGYMHEPQKTESNDALLPTLTVPEKKWNEILETGKEKHQSCNVTAHLYPVMLGLGYELSVALENYGSEGFLSTAEIYLPLRQRIYGILLLEKPHTNFVNELCVQSMKCPTMADEVPITWITNIDKLHPGLQQLWSDSCDVDTRWNLFVQSLTLENKLNPQSLKNLGISYVVPVAVLYYLVQESKNILKEDEINVLLIQAALVNHYSPDDIKAMKNQLYLAHDLLPRAVEISTIFLRGVTMVLFLLGACGFHLKEAMPWYYFDGKLMFQKYIELVKEKKELRHICEDTSKSVDVYSTYRIMKNLVMPSSSLHQ